MAYLLRRLPNKNASADAPEPSLWEHDDCPFEAIEQVFNKDGISTWRVIDHQADSEEIQRLVAAQAFMRSTVGDIAYCLIDESALAAEGIATRDTVMRTVDKDFASKHVDIVNVTGKQLVKLTRIVFYSTPYVMARQEVLEVAKKFFAEGTFDRSLLVDRQSKKDKRREDDEDRALATARDLLVNLWKKREIDFV
jgi:hypothetical protein